MDLTQGAIRLCKAHEASVVHTSSGSCTLCPKLMRAQHAIDRVLARTSRLVSDALAQQDCGLVLMCLEKVWDKHGKCIQLNLKYPPMPPENSSEWSALGITDENSFFELRETALEVQLGYFKEQARRLAGQSPQFTSVCSSFQCEQLISHLTYMLGLLKSV